MKTHHITESAAIVVLFLGMMTAVSQEAPRFLPFQGRLADAAGKPLADGAKLLQFQIWDSPTGGTSLWAGELHRATINGGLVNVVLGTKNPLPRDRADQPGKSFFDQPLYLQITVDANGDDKIDPNDPPLLPRQSILPVLFALDAAHAANSDKLAGGTWSDLLSSNDPRTGLLKGGRLLPGSVPAASLEPAAQLGLRSTLVQGASVPGLTALEAISDHAAVAYTRDAGNAPRLVLASAVTAARSTFFGFATVGAPAGKDVPTHQYGPLGGFSGLIPGRSYYLSATPGAITSEYPSGIKFYVGHSMSDSILFVDPFGFSRSWAPSGNAWGNRADGGLETGGNVNFTALVDGEVVVKQFSSLVIKAGHRVTTDNRCRGLVIYVDGDAVVDGILTMTGRGGNVDPSLPDSIPPSGIRLVRRKAGGTDSLVASDLGGTGLGGVGAAWRSAEAAQTGSESNSKIYVIARGGGGGGSRQFGNASGNSGRPAENSTGGGGGGGNDDPGYGGAGASGTCYSGGAGGGGNHDGGVGVGGGDGAANGGPGGSGSGSGGVRGGGAAGNPSALNAENGTGGLLVLFVKGNLTIGSGGRIESNGSGGGGVFLGGGGGSGGGRVVVLYAGAFINQGSVEANGGRGGTATASRDGGPGGSGAVTIDKIDP